MLMLFTLATGLLGFGFKQKRSFNDDGLTRLEA
jgi:hypothetical protein